MRRTAGYTILFLSSFLLVSCFSITVNVYFPERDVKSAFKSLERQLMKGGEGEAPATPDNAPKETPEPQGGLRFELGLPWAYAQGTGELEAELAEKLKNDPAVVKAYRDMGARLAFVDRLRDQGLAGEGSDGLLKPRGELDKRGSLALKEENENRAVIIDAMAKAIVEINRQPVNKDTVGQVRDKAAGQFAEVRRESARPGWWVQGPDGGWAKK